MYLLQNLTCLTIPALIGGGFLLVLAWRFMRFTKVQLLVLAGGFTVAGLFIALLIGNLAGAVPFLFPALYFGVLGLIKHSRDLKLAQASLERQATARAQVPAVRPPAKSSPDSNSFDFD